MKPRLSYANVIATLALFLALGGVGYAATQLPKNSVGRGQLKANAVSSAKVANKSLTGSDIKTGSLPDCPGGMRLAAGACVETKAREKSPLGFAIVECAQEGMRLPTQGEMAAFDLSGGGSAGSGREWIEPVYFFSDGSERGNFVAKKGSGVEFGDEAAAVEYAYRCAVAATY